MEGWDKDGVVERSVKMWPVLGQVGTGWDGVWTCRDEVKMLLGHAQTG